MSRELKRKLSETNEVPPMKKRKIDGNDGDCDGEIMGSNDELNEGNNEGNKGGNDEDYEHECCICLDKITFPIKIPCGHVFCYLCLKEVRESNETYLQRYRHDIVLPFSSNNMDINELKENLNTNDNNNDDRKTEAINDINNISLNNNPVSNNNEVDNTPLVQQNNNDNSGDSNEDNSECNEDNNGDSIIEINGSFNEFNELTSVEPMIITFNNDNNRDNVNMVFTCPLCRTEINVSVIDAATVNYSQVINDIKKVKQENEGNNSKEKEIPIWQYSGRTGGWWLYEPKHNNIIENAYQEYLKYSSNNSSINNIDNNNGDSNDSNDDIKYSECIIEIGSKEYVCNFDLMVQYWIEKRHQERRIQRTIQTENSLNNMEFIKGCAGKYFKTNTN